MFHVNKLQQMISEKSIVDFWIYKAIGYAEAFILIRSYFTPAMQEKQ